MPYGTPPLTRQPEHGRFNRFLATLPPHDFSLLAPRLRTIALERGMMLHDVREEIEHVYFPYTGMVSLVAVMQSGATVETATVGRSGVIGASAGLGAHSTFARAIVQLPGTAAWIAASQFRAAAAQSQVIRHLIVRYNDLLLAQVQQSVACNALHALEARLCRWLLQTHDCTDGNVIALTQEFLGQMLGVRRTTVTIAARLLQGAGHIRYRRGHIQILDRKALEDIACKCYAVVRQNADKVFALPRQKVRREPGARERIERPSAKRSCPSYARLRICRGQPLRRVRWCGHDSWAPGNDTRAVPSLI